MAPILVVTGPCGVGKSTASRAVAASFERSAHLQIDHLLPVRGERDDELIGSIVVSSALTYARGGYTTVVDGILFAEGIAGLAQACLALGVPLHVAVLRTDRSTCMARAEERAVLDDPAAVALLNRRFDDVGPHESQVVDAAGSADEVAAAMLAAFHAGRLVEVERGRGSR